MQNALAQEGDGGVTIQLLNTLEIQLTFRDLGFTVGVDANLALDVAQRLIQVANVSLVHQMQQLAATPVAPDPKPKIDIVRARMPNPRG